MWSSPLFWKLFPLFSGVTLAVAVAFVFFTRPDFASLGYNLAALLAFSVILGSLTSWVTVRKIEQILLPLSALQLGFQAAAEGDYNREVPNHLEEELGELAATLVHLQRNAAQRETVLRENAERLTTVLGSMEEGVLAVSADQKILLANEASKKLLEISSDEVIGRPLVEVVRVGTVQRAVEDVLSGKPACEVDFQVTGSHRYDLSLRAAPLPDQPASGAVVVLRDVTDLKRLENLRSEFVANVSHELKTPLASVKAYAETLRLGAINDPEHRLVFVDRIEEQADRLHQLILDLLDLARVESGKKTFDISDVVMDNIVESCLSTFRDEAESKQLSLEVQPANAELLVRADEEGLLSILDNLVSNAIKYTPAGGAVSLGWHADGNFVVIWVKDTGLGIDVKDQQRVFERFFRVDKARSRELGGTGLGLSIVKHLAQAFGGEVSLESQPGAGSTFLVRLPAP